METYNLYCVKLYCVYYNKVIKCLLIVDMIVINTGIIQNELSLLLGRLQKYVEKIIVSYQCSFKKNKSTIDHIFVMS